MKIEVRPKAIALAVVALALALVLGLWPGTAPAADWSRFRGPNGDGVADAPRLPTLVSPGANVAWKKTVPAGYSSPVLFGDRLFLTAEEEGRLLTLCLRRSDGQELWRRESPRTRKETLDKRNHHAAASAAVDDRRIVVFFHDFGLVAYDHEGQEKWRAPLGPFDNVYGMGASPILVDGLVVLVCDQVTASFIVAFDAETGRERWRTPRPQALSGHSTPILLAAASGGTAVIAPGSFRLDAYDPATGAVLWSTDGLPAEMKSGAVLGEGMVFVVGYNSPLNDPGQQPKLPPYAEWRAAQDKDKDGRITKPEADPTTQQYFVFIDHDRDGSISEAEWLKNLAMVASENGLLAIRPPAPGDPAQGTVAWRYGRAVPQLPTPVLYRGLLYMINDGGILTTLDPKTGAVHKQGRLRGAVDQYFASPVAGDGKVYFVSRTGIVTVVKAGPDQEVLFVGELDEEVKATPALADGRIYLRTKSALYCFGAGASPGTN
jgi:outer membrane protein assembly factor BamB